MDPGIQSCSSVWFPATSPKCFVLQVHAWVTAMPLERKRFKPWETLKDHPLLPVPVQRSKRPQTGRLQKPSNKLGVRPAAGKPAHAKPSNKAAAGRSNQKPRLWLCTQMHHPCCPKQHCPFRMDCTQNLLLSKQLQSSRLETYILCLPWGPAGQFFMLGTYAILLR